jgi:hypothetical protein
LQKIKEYINENFEYWKPNWKDEKENKYYINYDAQDGTFSRQSNQFYYSACPLYFRTYNEVNEIIEKFEPELKILFDIN